MARRRLLAVIIILFLCPLTVESASIAIQGPGASLAKHDAVKVEVGETCLTNGGAAIKVPLSTRVALVKPVFTATPYSEYDYGSFYAFFHEHSSAKGNFTTDLGLLNTSLSMGMNNSRGWGSSFSLFQFMSSSAASNCGLVMGRNVEVVSDVNVTDGALVGAGGARAYDVVVVGFSEYVTAQEYAQFQRFVASGGRLIVMSSDDFEVKVAYSSRTNSETFVLGHGFAFNGFTAWRSVDNAWESQDVNWLGSSKCCFYSMRYSGAQVNNQTQLGSLLQTSFGSTVFVSYASHEENSIRNFTDTKVVATFGIQSSIVGAYIHEYGLGTVVCLCVFATDIIGSDQSAQYFLVLGAALSDPGGPPASTPGPRASRLTFSTIDMVGFLAVTVLALAYAVWRNKRIGAAKRAQAPGPLQR